MMPVFRTLRIVSVRLVMFSQNLTSHEYTFFYEINNGAETSLLTLPYFEAPYLYALPLVVLRVLDFVNKGIVLMVNRIHFACVGI